MSGGVIIGIYDEYEGVQLKVGDVSLSSYKTGDDVEIADGVYIAPDGVVVISEGKLFRVYESHEVWDKWGGRLDPEALVGMSNPVTEALQEAFQTGFGCNCDCQCCGERSDSSTGDT